MPKFSGALVDYLCCFETFKDKMKANLPPNEEARLKALHEYQILDTLPQQAYDDITHLAAQICGAPIALVSLVDSDRQWFKARIGVEAEELPRDIAFCAHAILEPNELFIVPDAHQDERFADNPLVTGNPNIRFYAGAPLVTPEGNALGTLCVIDRQPRQLSEEQLSALRALARQVMAQMQLQKYFDELSQTMHEHRRMERELRASEQRFQAFMDNSPTVAFVKDEAGVYTYVNRPFLKRFQLQEKQVIGKNDLDLWPEAVAKELREHDLSVLEGNKTVSLIESVPDEDGKFSHWLTFKFPLQNKDKRFLAGIAIDITQSKRSEQELEEYKNKLETLVAQLEIQSRRDGLTGLLNRRAFDEKLDEEFARAPLRFAAFPADAGRR